MVRRGRFVSLIGLLVAPCAWAAVPGQINHQGVIRVQGDLFTGTGQFRFAIFDPDTGQNYWTNDNTFVPGPGTPTAHVPIPVTDGVYSVRLGDTSLAGMTNVIPPSVFNDSNAALRVWFNDGVNGIQQFDPHPLTSTPYSHQAAFQPPIGSIIAWHKSFPDTPALPEGWAECNGQTLNDPKSPYDGATLPNLNGERRFLRGGSSSGGLEAATEMAVQPDLSRIRPFHPRNYDGFTDEGPASTATAEAFPPAAAVRWVSFRPVNMTVVWIMRVK